MDDELWSFVVGVALVAFIWFLCVGVVEKSKVNAGYLTYQNKTYRVTLHDSLDIPEKEK